MFKRLSRIWDDAGITADTVILADGQVLIVPRGNLAAAKALLAAHKAANQRVAAQEVTELVTAAERELGASRSVSVGQAI